MNHKLTKVLCGIFAVLAVASFCFALIASQGASAAEPKLQPRTAELRKADSEAGKPQLAADEADKKNFEMKKLSDKVYRVEVSLSADGLAECEKAWVKFSEEHPTARWSPPMPNPKGNTAVLVYYWNVN